MYFRCVIFNCCCEYQTKSIKAIIVAPSRSNECTRLRWPTQTTSQHFAVCLRQYVNCVLIVFCICHAFSYMLIQSRVHLYGKRKLLLFGI